MPNLINLTSGPKKDNKQDIKIIKTKPDIKSKTEDKQDIRVVYTILGMTK